MHSQRGSILVFVTLTVAILMIVGATFATATTAEYRSAMHHTQGTQAFYIAEAGLNWARHGLGNGSIVLPSIGIEQTHILYRSAAFGTPVGTQVLADIGEIEVVVRRLTASRIELVVQGRQQLARRTLSIQADETTDVDVENVLARHQVVGEVNLGEEAEIRGDISAGSFVWGEDARIIDGKAIIGPPLASFRPPTFVFPSGLTSRGAVTVREGRSASLSVNSSYTDVTVQEDGVLIINVPDARDVVLSIENLTLHEDAQINRTGDGTGRVLLHIRQRMIIGEEARINGHIERMIVYYHGTTRLTLGEDSSLTGILVTNNAPVTLAEGARLDGHLITGATEVRVSEDARLVGVLYAPHARVDIGEGALVEGVLIADRLFVGEEGKVNRAAGGIESFTPALGLWSTYSFHTWGSR
ncbi:MAG: pilus assembly PilX N-terminal domain-containing protein [Selenomonadales bacterium]|nr:pilus assembly PilX N-terminal domain-containing protein [Selenomonadales bacterium]